MSGLYAHQIAGAEWLERNRRSLLGDAPRVGKSRTLIKAAELAESEHALVVCPAVVRSHWRSEFDAMRWSAGATVKSFDEIVRGGMRLMRDLLAAGVDTLIIDECHAVRHATAQRTQILMGKDGYARRVPNAWLASGTPVPKNPAELFTQLCFLRPEVLRAHGVQTLDRWQDAFCEMHGRFLHGRWVESPRNGVVRNREKFRAILTETMLRRTLDDLGLDVPNLDFQVVRLDGGVDEWAADGGALAGETLARGESLESIANDPSIARMRRRLGELKAPIALDMIRRDLEEGDENLVVFAYHRSVLSFLRDGLAEFGVAYIDGDTPDRARDEARERFQSRQCRVFLGQVTACKEGLTLTAARRAVSVEPDWSAYVNFQSGNRVFDVKQPGRHCVVELIALAGTIDEAVVQQNAREARMEASVLAKETLT